MRTFLPVEKILFTPSPAAVDEEILRATARDELPALSAADLAANALGWILEGMGVPSPESDPPPAAYYRTKGLFFLGVLAARAARSLITLACSGYVEQALVFQRALGEARGRAQRIVQDESGQYAREWLEGKGGSAAKSAGDLGQELWTELSRSAHADVRTLGRVATAQGEDTFELNYAPRRRAGFENAALALCAGQTADVAFAISFARGVEIPGQEEVVKALRGILDTYLPEDLDGVR